MMPRTEYEMTESNMQAILDASQPTPVMMIGGSSGSSPQENANRAWASLGSNMGFDSKTVRPSSGKGQRFFTAIPNETPEAKAERKARDAEEKNLALIAKLEGEISKRTALLAKLTGNDN
jgi:hypothetical protein